MYSEAAVLARYCSNCDRCDEIVRENQAILPHAVNVGSNTQRILEIKQKLEKMKSQYTCASCNIIKGKYCWWYS